MPKYNDVHLHRLSIRFIAARLPADEVYDPKPGNGRLESILRELQSTHLPSVSTRGLRKWWEFFLQFGDVKPIVERRRKGTTKRYGRRAAKGHWDANRTLKLKKIVDEYPQLYLDEIQDVFFIRHGELWSTSYLWKRLHADCNYSLQVATDRATKRQQEDIDGYFDDMKKFVAHPSQLIFVDESAKDRNSSRRRRSWSKPGQTPFRPSYLAPLYQGTV